MQITVDPADDSDEANKDAELVRQFVNREVLQAELQDILDAIGKGFSVTEIMWETSAKQWMPNELRWVDPRFIDFDRDDRRTPLLKTATGLESLAPWKYVRLEIMAKSGLPIQGGLARGVGWAYLFKNFDIKAWMQFAEVYGQPIRVGKYGPGATKEDRRTLLRAVANIGTDAAAIIPQSMELEFIKADQKSSADMYLQLAEFMERQVSKAVLGQTTTTDAISGGHAVAKEHNEVREDIEKADAKALGAALKQCIVIPMINLNHGPRKAYPSIQIGRVPQINAVEFTTNVDTLVRLGMPVSMSHVRETVGVKEPESEEDTLRFVQPIPSSEPAPEPAPKPAKASAEDTPPSTDQIQDFLASLSEGDDLESIVAPLIAPLDDLFAKAESYDDIKNQLVERLGSMDLTTAIEQMARALFAARIAGEVGADIDNDD